MTTVTITESGMTFGPFAKGQCFYIEKSATYKKIQESVKIAEFLLIRFQEGQPPTVWIIEAKKSSPNPEKPENQQSFKSFICEIQEKLVNALTLSIAACLQRHPDADVELPAHFKTLDLRIARFRLVLVLKGYEKKWLVPLQKALPKALHTTIKIWGLPPNSVAVINDTIARKYGLIATDAAP